MDEMDVISSMPYMSYMPYLPHHYAPSNCTRKAALTSGARSKA